jgi:prevent-host-death family protein
VPLRAVAGGVLGTDLVECDDLAGCQVVEATADRGERGLVGEHHLAELLDEVAERREHVTVTRSGRPATVMVPVDQYKALEETAEIIVTVLDPSAQLRLHPLTGAFLAGSR